MQDLTQPIPGREPLPSGKPKTRLNIKVPKIKILRFPRKWNNSKFKPHLPLPKLKPPRLTKSAAVKILSALLIILIPLYLGNYLRKRLTAPQTPPSYLIEYTRQGGSDGLCDQLTVYLDAGADLANTCLNQSKSLNLTPEAKQKLIHLHQNYSSLFWVKTKNSTSDPEIQLKFLGKGKRNLIQEPNELAGLLQILNNSIINNYFLTQNPGSFPLADQPGYDPNLDWKIYTNPYFNFSFQYPEIFQTRESDKNEPPAVFRLATGPIITTIYQTDLEINNFIQKYICNPDLDCNPGSSPADISIDGLPGKKIITLQPNVTETAIVRKESLIYSITLVLENSQSPQQNAGLKNIYQQLLASFKLTDGVHNWNSFRSPTYNFEFLYPPDYSASQNGSLTTIAKQVKEFSGFQKGEYLEIRTISSFGFQYLSPDQTQEVLYSREKTINDHPAFIQMVALYEENGQLSPFSYISIQIQSTAPAGVKPYVSDIKTGIYDLLAPLDSAFLSYTPEKFETQIIGKLSVYNQLVKTFNFRKYTGDLKAKCLLLEGNWREDYLECENLNEASCKTLNGIYYQCASPCRHKLLNQACSQNCVQVCKIIP